MIDHKTMPIHGYPIEINEVEVGVKVIHLDFEDDDLLLITLKERTNGDEYPLEFLEGIAKVFEALLPTSVKAVIFPYDLDFKILRVSDRQKDGA